MKLATALTMLSLAALLGACAGARSLAPGQSTEADVRALETTELRIMSALTVGQNPGPVSSMLKLRWSEIHQDITRLGVRLLGPDALLWETAPPRMPIPRPN